MVKDELKDEIKKLFRDGYSYRALRDALGVGHWTINRVKQELEREERERMIMESLARKWDEWSRQWKRVTRKALRKGAELTDEKLGDLWGYWVVMEFENITLERFIDRYLEACVKPMVGCYVGLLQQWTAGLSGLLRSMTCIR